MYQQQQNVGLLDRKSSGSLELLDRMIKINNNINTNNPNNPNNNNNNNNNNNRGILVEHLPSLSIHDGSKEHWANSTTPSTPNDPIALMNNNNGNDNHLKKKLLTSSKVYSTSRFSFTNEEIADEDLERPSISSSVVTYPTSKQEEEKKKKKNQQSKQIKEDNEQLLNKESTMEGKLKDNEVKCKYHPYLPSYKGSICNQCHQPICKDCIHKKYYLTEEGNLKERYSDINDEEYGVDDGPIENLNSLRQSITSDSFSNNKKAEKIDIEKAEKQEEEQLITICKHCSRQNHLQNIQLLFCLVIGFVFPFLFCVIPVIFILRMRNKGKKKRWWIVYWTVIGLVMLMLMVTFVTVVVMKSTGVL
ncbi:hypothetical protein ABK040_013318 [Willaertia magna]